MNLANLFRNEPNPVEGVDGQRIIDEGGKSDRMYVVLEGTVDIVVAGQTVESVGEGGVFGEMSLIDDQAASASAVVRGGAKLASIDERRFLFLVQQHPTFALNLMRVMSGRLRKMDRQRA
ncbi:MAG: cyclic nucleotide-binding domain-containing protein [Verrucomicrobiae bacterium]|nr:cyclic nucleotide-binding domain-containing protein [Verrucomicrobiae bacterium]MCP5551419.1 cyclic nucleotide-binding domain-containing protein [Akkermansiaceae bacterium]